MHNLQYLSSIVFVGQASYLREPIIGYPESAGLFPLECDVAE